MNKTVFISLLLGLSVALNSFLAGVLVSRQTFVPPPFLPPPPLERMEQALSVLSEEQRPKIAAILKRHQATFEEHRIAMQKKIKRVQAILTAPTFDEKAFEQAIGEKPGHDEMRDNMKKLLSDIAKALPDEERARYFKETVPKFPSPPEREDHGPRP